MNRYGLFPTYDICSVMVLYCPGRPVRRRLSGRSEIARQVEKQNTNEKNIKKRIPILDGDVRI
jgi:hypothetical protein